MLNYTTKVPAQQSIAEISQMLAEELDINPSMLLGPGDVQ